MCYKIGQPCYYNFRNMLHTVFWLYDSSSVYLIGGDTKILLMEWQTNDPAMGKDVCKPASLDLCNHSSGQSAL